MAKQEVVHELFYGGQWHTAPAYVRDQTVITRGKGDGQGGPVPSTLACTLDNRDGTYNPRNPSSALYGAGRNTPTRVKYDTETTTTVTEDFEDDFLEFGNTNVSTTADPTDADWSRDSGESHGGSWSLKSGDVDDDEHSLFIVTIPTGATSVSFWYKVSSEVGFDKLLVWIDDNFNNDLVASGTVDWTKKTIALTDNQKITFDYHKDSSTSTGSDAAWIDDLEFTIPTHIRFVGEATKWAPDRTVDFDKDSGRGDAWTDIQAAGLLRRLGQGDPPVVSAMRDWVLNNTDPVGYWPMEDDTDASHFANAVAGGTSLTLTAGSQQLAADDSLPGSKPLPLAQRDSDLQPTTKFAAPVRINGGQFTLAWWERARFVAGTGGFAASTVTIDIDGSPDFDNWYFGITRDQDNETETYRAFAATTADPTTPVAGFDLPFPTGDLSDAWRYVEVKVSASAGIGLVRMWVDGTQVGSATFSASDSDMGDVTGIHMQVGVSPNDRQSIMSVGHLAIFDGNETTTGGKDAGLGHPGETAGDRFTRLCENAGIGYAIVGDADDTMPMGPQYPDTLLNLLAEIERTDAGLLYESRVQLGLVYRTRVDLYNQDAALTLDWDQGQVAPPLKPVIDDVNTRNVIVASRRNGSSFTAEQTSGPLNTQSPDDDADGVGRYPPSQVDLNPETDAALTPLAYWYLHLGTVDEARFPQVTVDVDEVPDAAAVDIGDKIKLTNLPADLSPNDVELIVIGYTETIASHTRFITFNCVPASAYEVGVYGTDRYEGNATLESAITTTATSFSTVSLGVVFGWTTDDDDFPFDINVGGERMTVTDISHDGTPPTGSVDTLTVIRSVNGVVKSHPAGTPVRLWKQARYAL